MRSKCREAIGYLTVTAGSYRESPVRAARLPGISVIACVIGIVGSAVGEEVRGCLWPPGWKALVGWLLFFLGMGSRHVCRREASWNPLAGPSSKDAKKKSCGRKKQNSSLFAPPWFR